MQAEKPKEQWLYNGTLDCAVKIVKDEGNLTRGRVRVRDRGRLRLRVSVSAPSRSSRPA